MSLIVDHRFVKMPNTLLLTSSSW